MCEIKRKRKKQQQQPRTFHEIFEAGELLTDGLNVRFGEVARARELVGQVLRAVHGGDKGRHRASAVAATRRRHVLERVHADEHDVSDGYLDGPGDAAELAAHLDGDLGDDRLGFPVVRVDDARGDHLAGHAKVGAALALDGVVDVLLLIGYEAHDNLRLGLLDRLRDRLHKGHADAAARIRNASLLGIAQAKGHAAPNRLQLAHQEVRLRFVTALEEHAPARHVRRREQRIRLHLLLPAILGLLVFERLEEKHKAHIHIFFYQQQIKKQTRRQNSTHSAKVQRNVLNDVGVDGDELRTEVDLPLVEIFGSASLGLELGDELVELEAAPVRVELRVAVDLLAGLKVAREIGHHHGARHHAQLGHEHDVAIARRQVLAVGSLLRLAAILLLGQADEQRLVGVANAHLVLAPVVVHKRDRHAAALLERVARLLLPVDVVDAIRLVVVAFRYCFLLI